MQENNQSPYVHRRHQTVGKKLKRIGDLTTSSGYIDSGYKDVIWLSKMCHANNEKREKRQDGRNQTTKSRKIRNLQILGNIRSGHHQTSGDKRKKNLRRIRKLLETKQYSSKLIKGKNTRAISLVRYSGLFLKWTKEELQPMDQKTNDNE